MESKCVPRLKLKLAVSRNLGKRKFAAKYWRVASEVIREVSFCQHLMGGMQSLKGKEQLFVYALLERKEITDQANGLE